MANSRLVRLVKRPLTCTAALVMVGALLQAAPAASLTYNTRPEATDEESVPGSDVEGPFTLAAEGEDTVAQADLDEPPAYAWPEEAAGEAELAEPGAEVEAVEGLVTVSQVTEDGFSTWTETEAEVFSTDPAEEADPDGTRIAPTTGMEPPVEEGGDGTGEREPQRGPEDGGAETGPEAEEETDGEQPAPEAEPSPEAEEPAVPDVEVEQEEEETVEEAAPVESVHVEVLGQDTAEAVGVHGLLLRVTRADGHAGVGPVDLTVDYSEFADAFGGDFGARLQLIEVDPCLAEEGTGCQDRAPQLFTTDNDAEARTVSGTVPALAGEGLLLAVAAAGESPRGDYKATDLAAASSWDVGLQSGDFSWNYPIDTPPVASDLTPGIELTYSSGSVDGRVASSNNQTSWLGEGFNYSPGFIERRYAPCSDSQPDSGKTGDLCWSRHNATFSLNGRSGEMFLDEDGTWRMRHDDASEIERLTGTTNGDNDGEYWRITTTDGTQYYFGMNRLPGYSSGKTETNSAWTAPVYGDGSGEPCNKSSFADSWCQQGWRWNLDYVVDVHGNVMTYYYTKENNYYGRNMKADSPTVYTRGGHLNRIEYGLRSDNVYGTAPGRVNFSVGERCIPTDSFDCAENKFTSANASHWPDVPFDQHCAQGQNCTNRFSPTFWTRKKLNSITTQVHDGTTYRNVDSWKLTHAYPQTGDGTPPDLWLQSIEHTGHVGGEESMPLLEFGGTPMENRVDTTDDGFAPMLKWRITKILTESGSQIDITYEGGECDPAQTPAPHDNGTRCFPVVNTTADGKSEYTDWFHKYVVTQVSELDLVTDQPERRTTYDYVGDAAWRYRDADGFIRDKLRTWSDWRGYAQVRVIEGLPNETRSETEHRFFRGMHGDRQPTGTRTVKVTDSEGNEHTDLNEYNGFTLEEITRNGPGGDIVEKTISLPWSRVTAQRTYSWGTLESRMTGMASTTQYIAVDGGWMRTQETAEYDALGRTTQVHHHGDVDDTGDDQCTRYTYADNTTLRILDAVARTEKVAVGCGATPSRPGDVISDERVLYDGRGYGQAPTAGLPTATQRIEDYDGSTAVYQTVQETEYDAFGRPVSESDALGNATVTSYSPKIAGGVATTVTTTNPLGHVDTEHFDPLRGLPVAEIDPNGNRTDMAHDPLGRLTQVWTPDRKKADGIDPAMRFEYHVRNDAPSAVITHTRREDGTYASTYQIYDGLLRLRQEQAPAAVGDGRLISDVFYDGRGLKIKERHGYHNEEAGPGQTLFEPAQGDDRIPRYTETVYDGAERPVEVISLSRGGELWRTNSQDLGDRVLVTPADGAIPTTTIKNALGQTVELRQHEGDTPQADYTALTYTYTEAGEVATITDGAGNVWRNHYDLRGRKIKTEDPDRGTTTYTYDDADRLVSRTDARGETVSYVYDALGRKTGQHQGGTDGPLLASWTFDTVAKGQLSNAVRYVDGQQYTTTIHAYDPLGRSTATTVYIPRTPENGGLGGPYRFRTTYNSDGTIKSNTLPAAGGLPEEVVTYAYNRAGLVTGIHGASETFRTDYLNAVTYSHRGQILQRTFYRNDGNSQARETWATRVYDPATDRVTVARVHPEVGHGTLVEQAYTYDDAGNVLSIKDEPTAEGLLPDVQCFAYDDMRRLTDEWTSLQGGEQACDGGPARENVGGAAPYWNSYTYDALGNRTSETRRGLIEAGDIESTYHRPGAGEERPHAVTQVDSNGNSGLATYTYDEAGNMTSRRSATRDQTLEWNAEGQLAAVREGGNTSRFVYDAEGERLIRDDGNAVTLFLPGMEVSFNKEELTSQATRLYEHEGEVIASRSSSGDVHWIFSDHHQTGQLAINSLTGESVRRRFTAFGTERGTATGTWPNSRGYVGGVIDEQAGFTRLGARSYDSETGMFISADPVVDFSDSQQMNGYAYANNNPTSFTDPDGLYYRKSFSQARKWAAAYRARQAAIRAYQARMAAIRAYRIRQAAIRAYRARQAAIRAAKIRAAQIRAARAANAARKAAAMRIAAARRAAAAKAARDRIAREKAARSNASRDKNLGMYDGPKGFSSENPRKPERLGLSDEMHEWPEIAPRQSKGVGVADPRSPYWMRKERRLLPGGSFEAYALDNEQCRQLHVNLVGNAFKYPHAVIYGAAFGLIGSAAGPSGTVAGVGSGVALGGWAGNEIGQDIGWVGGAFACRF
ncbi:RHS repeat domain-containing protein [Nocardiopsis changdeensis]|uniref:RHS repeat-associated core domain-containing protein n=2 Tax=Nocardiopsis changdeensis TaxID=2831969 RepID=A0ABX8BK78_9ACTN|nr:MULTISPECIES: RHS repeat-associated core domain-containing protein [Nocardiopsis]QUX22135.1 RHS repeat-associated core domain-containing protein [Nocardiopsis changdeensis]QYX38074.1 type IV secretion protein Rhs [Nocardiopsis sp. MT53]